MIGWAACPTLYAQHCTKELIFTIIPYTASASVPRYFTICLLNRIVRIPIATSIKNVEKPVTQISLSLPKSFSGFTRRRVFFFVKKWESITIKVIPDPMAVASPAPNAPISHVKTKK